MLRLYVVVTYSLKYFVNNVQMYILLYKPKCIIDKLLIHCLNTVETSIRKYFKN